MTNIASKRWTRGLATLFVCLAVITVYSIWDLQRDVDQRPTRGEYNALISSNKELVERQNDARAQAELLEQQVKELGERPVVDPDDLEDIPVPLPVAPEISETDLDAAVARYCSVNSCGVRPTNTQVAASVALFCDSNGDCRGRPGDTGGEGEPGANGSDGATGPEGPQGPPPTDAQVLAAVQTYCGNRDNCQGPKGDKGDKGEPGVSVVRVSCDSDDSNGNGQTEFIVFLSDGTSSPVQDSDCVAGGPPILDN